MLWFLLVFYARLFALGMHAYNYLFVYFILFPWKLKPCIYIHTYIYSKQKSKNNIYTDKATLAAHFKSGGITRRNFKHTYTHAHLELKENHLN